MWYVSSEFNGTTKYYNFETQVYQKKLTKQCYTTVYNNAVSVASLGYMRRTTIHVKV